MDIKTETNQLGQTSHYYVHYIGHDDRLNRWLDANLLDMSRVLYPKKATKRFSEAAFVEWDSLSEWEKSTVGESKFSFSEVSFSQNFVF